MLVFIFLSLLGRLIGAESKALVFVPEKLRGGIFDVGTQKQYEVQLCNQQGSEVRIVSIESDCDCLQITGKPELVKGKALLTLSYQSEKEVAARVQVKVRYCVGGKIEEAVMIFVAEVIAREKARFDIAANAVINQTGSVLVDVRSLDQFKKVRIPGSLNLPLFAIKTKGLLRSRRLVLVGKGDGDGALGAEAAALKALGFEEVKVLRGGIGAWELAGGHLERVEALNLDAVPGVRSEALLKEIGNDVTTSTGASFMPLTVENRVTVRGVKLVGAPGGGLSKKGCGACP